MIDFWNLAIDRHMRRSLESPFFVQSLLMQLSSLIKICLRRTVLDFFIGIYINILGGIHVLNSPPPLHPLFISFKQFYIFLRIWFLLQNCFLLFPCNSSKATNVLLLLGKVAAYALTITGFFYCQVTPALRREGSLRWHSSE